MKLMVLLLLVISEVGYQVAIPLTIGMSQNFIKCTKLDFHSYNATDGCNTRDSIGTALRGYWIPDETGTIVPEVSLGYDTKSYGGVFTAGITQKQIVTLLDLLGRMYS